MPKALNITGRRYGKLTAISFVGKEPRGNKNNVRLWKCKCDCGNTIIAIQNSLQGGKRSSCGECLTPETDLTGKVFGRLTVVSYIGKQHKQRLWNCLCSCGNKTVVSTSNLKYGSTQSCGCLRKERALIATTKHGMVKSRLYRAWFHMRKRCSSEYVKCYHNYGGRGIRVCDEWDNSFEKFRDWALANGYTEKLTLDRIDNNKGYSPDNCRWVTMKVQENNKRTNDYLTFNGKTQSLTMWAEEIGINPGTLYGRIHQSKWSIEDALTTPKLKKGEFLCQKKRKQQEHH